MIERIVHFAYAHDSVIPFALLPCYNTLMHRAAVKRQPGSTNLLGHSFMGGVNPYIEKVRASKAVRPFQITFHDEATATTRSVSVDPATYPMGHIGLEGSILDIASEAGVELDHACGGVCACSTCHVYVTQGLTSCSKATDDEDDELDKAPGLTPESRLSCQCVPDGTADLMVLLPKWNRNHVRE